MNSTTTTSAETSGACQWCGLHGHTGICPSIKAIEYFEDGQVKRVEFKTAADYPAYQVPAHWPQPQWRPLPPVTWGPGQTTTMGSSDTWTWDKINATMTGRGFYEEDAPGYDEAS